MEYSLYSKTMFDLKQILKKQKISYLTLSQKLNVPESTLKKWFMAKNGSLNQVDMICQALGIQMVDLLQAMEKKSVETILFTQEQQQFFQERFAAFEVYWGLVYERLTPIEIRNKLQLSEDELLRHMIQLDKLDMIQYGQNGKVTVPKTVPVRWNREGHFMQRIFTAWCEEVLRTALTNKVDDNLTLQYFQVSPESAKELKNDILKLEEKYARRTISEMSIYGSSLQRVRFVCALAEGSFLSENTIRAKA